MPKGDNPKSAANLTPFKKNDARTKRLAKKAGTGCSPAKRIALRFNRLKRSNKLTAEQLQFIKDTLENPESSLAHMRARLEDFHHKGSIEDKDYLTFLEKYHKLTHGEKIKHEHSGVVGSVNVSVVKVVKKEEDL
jgi:predicted RNase H-like nuclease